MSYSILEAVAKLIVLVKVPGECRLGHDTS